jgi:threonine synthase
MQLTSANSINVARFLPQSFYYFSAYAQLDKIGKAGELTVCVPSGNFGNITAGLFACKMGLPVKHFIAANNRNNVYYDYLKTGIYTPRPSVATIANAMDVGNPSNFARILDLFGNDHRAITQLISGHYSTDEEIANTLRQVYHVHHYILDPHGATSQKTAFFTVTALKTAHPTERNHLTTVVIRLMFMQ